MGSTTYPYYSGSLSLELSQRFESIPEATQDMNEKEYKREEKKRKIRNFD
jgi:hypothetical protein